MDDQAAITPDEILPPKPLHKRPVFKPKQPGTLNKTTRQAVKLAAQYDIPPRDAYTAVTGAPPAEGTLKRMETAIAEWSLRHPDRLRKASKNIAKIANGQEINGIKPKDSTVLAANLRILDATDPIVKQSVVLTGNLADFLPVDPTRYSAE